MTLQELLEQYSVTVDELETAQVVIEGLEGEALETVISDFAKKKKDDKEKDVKPEDKKPADQKPEDKAKSDEVKKEDPKAKGDVKDPKAKEDVPAKKDEKPVDEEAKKKAEEDKKKKAKQKGKFENEEDQADYDSLLALYNDALAENKKLQAFKKAVEDGQHEEKVLATIEGLGLTDEDEGVTEIKENALDFSLEQVEEKCYGILGRKAFSKKQSFSKKENTSIHLPLGNEKDKQETPKPYGGLLRNY